MRSGRSITTVKRPSRHAKTARNEEIAHAFHAGETLRSIAARHGICISRVSIILKQLGARLPHDELQARLNVTRAAVAKTPEVKVRIAAALRARTARGLHNGKPRIFADDPVRREEYLTLAQVMGAAYAREAMGVPA